MYTFKTILAYIHKGIFYFLSHDIWLLIFIYHFGEYVKILRFLCIDWKHGVCDKWIECRWMMLFYKGGLHETYNFRDEAMRAWMLYPPWWKRPEVAATFSRQVLKYGHDVDHYMQYNIWASLVCSVIGAIRELFCNVLLSELWENYSP